MNVLTKDGLKEVIQVEETRYNKNVYNFKFMDHTILLGNDIDIGDYAYQNEINELTEYPSVVV